MGDGLMKSFCSSLDFFEGALALLQCAEARILVAGSALGVEADLVKAGRRGKRRRRDPAR
jgi:hypothetical protein